MAIPWLTARCDNNKVVVVGTFDRARDLSPSKCHEVLERVFDSPATRVCISTRLPIGIDEELLQRVFCTTRVLRLQYGGKPEHRALCKALAHEACMIETLSMVARYVIGIPEFNEAFAVNKSLRQVFSWHGTPDVCRVLSQNTAIEHLQFAVVTMGKTGLAKTMRQMPSLTSIGTSWMTPPPMEDIRAVWPDCVPGREGALLRDRSVLFYDERRKLRALYECAGRVLPDHVIHDIAAVALEKMDGGEEVWCKE